MDMYTFAPSILLVKSDSQIFMLGYCWLLLAPSDPHM